MVVFLSKYYFILYRSLCACLNLLFGTPLYILTLSKPLPSLSCRGSHFCHPFSLTSPCQISPDDNSTKTNYITTMRFLLTFIFILILGSCLSQDTIDTVLRGDVIYLYKKGLILERHYMKGDQIDIKVIYVYRDGLLVRREWWKDGKRLSYTIDN